MNRAVPSLLSLAFFLGCSYDSSVEFAGGLGGPDGPGSPVPCNTSPCQNNAQCTDSSECQSFRCERGVCLASAANDGVKNGTETDVDCGGPSAQACADSRTCSVGSDCQSLSCRGGVCAPPSSSDGVKNGTETDVDCGGGAPACAAGLACAAGTDCREGWCPAPAAGALALCVTPTASDGILNGNESDVDCGRSGPGFDTGAPGCRLGAICLAHGDCASNGCNEEGPAAGKCAVASSCTMYDGGYTCGADEIPDDAPPGPNHESCCTSLPVPGYSDPAYPGKVVTLDKYEITGGRMRKFLERIAAENAGVPRVRSWMQEHLVAAPGIRWNDTASEASNWTRWLPEGTGGRAADADQTNWNANTVALFGGRGHPSGSAPGSHGNVGTDYLFGQAGYYFYVHGHNCDAGTGYGSYWYPEDVMTSVHQGSARRLAQKNLDRRSMNCSPLVMFAALCAWEGGQMATSAVLSAVTGVAYGQRDTSNAGAVGRLPARATSNWTGDAGASPTVYNVPSIALEAARIAPPGRMTGDRVEYSEGGVAAGPWMDLRGNLQEAAILETANPLTFAGVHYDGIGRDSARAVRDDQAVYAEFRTGTVGARCMRYRDP